jgi:hypothetical protein
MARWIGVQRCALLAVVGTLAACGEPAVEAPGIREAPTSAGRPPGVERPEEDMAPGRRSAWVDFGAGPVARGALGELRAGPQPIAADSGASALITGGPEAHREGAFGSAFPWPVIPIHAALLPDGRVLGYGTDLAGVQGSKLYYTVWNPALGVGADAISVLPNTTATDIFCAGQALMPGSGRMLIVGGDTRDAWNRRNFGISDVARFDPATDTLSRDSESMSFRRWYASLVTLSNGDMVALGGRMDRATDAGDNGAPQTFDTFATTPEVFSPVTGWRRLDTADSDDAYGSKGAHYNYPRAWLAPDDRVFVLGHNGNMFSLGTSGSGDLRRHELKIARSKAKLPSVMFEPGRILSLREEGRAYVIDINGAQPVVTETGSPSQYREYAMATVLADGQVLISGGSSGGNSLDGAAYHTELWNIGRGTFRRGAVAAKARLYHSTAILLPDATVMVGGGGAVGPVDNLNAEIYYPPYLFKRNGSGELASRPVVVAAPPHRLDPGATFEVDLAPGTTVSRVTMVRTGSATHSFNGEQRFKALAYERSGDRLALRLPASRTMLPPGWYLLFVFDAEGVPSLGRVIGIG